MFRESPTGNTVNPNVTTVRILKRIVSDTRFWEHPLFATRISSFPVTKKIFRELINAEMDIVKEITSSSHGREATRLASKNDPEIEKTFDPLSEVYTHKTVIYL